MVERVVEDSLKGLLQEAMSSDEVYSKYYGDIDRAVFDAAVKSDPTSKGDHAGRYVKWILNLYRNGSWKPGDSYETKDVLSRFHRMRGSLERKDINMYPSVKAVMDVVMDKKTGSDVKRGGADKVYEDSEWLIVIPRTEEASKLYGKGTKWCTAADQDNWFNYYNSMGPLYINVDKRTGEKYQFHFETESFMDAEDDEINPTEIGLSDGAMDYYETIGKKRNLLPFDECVKYCMDYVKRGANVEDVFDYAYPLYSYNGWIVTLRDKENVITPERNLLWDGEWFDDIDPYDDGFFCVYYEGQSGDEGTGYNYIGRDGKLLSDKWFREAMSFHDGKASVVDWDGNSWVLLKNGRLRYEGGLPTWNGVPYSGWRHGGSNSPGSVFYDGEDINDWDLNDFAWEQYRYECEENGVEPDEDGFDKLPADWFKNVLDEYCYAEFGDDSVNESLVRKVVMESFRNLLMNEAMDMDSVYAKYYSDVDRNVFDAAVKCDPTSKGNHAGKYVKWIMDLYRKGSWKPGDSYETRDALSRFDRLKGRLQKRDINAYGSVMDLMRAVSDQRSSMDVKKEGAEKVYEDSDWVVIVPHTEEASKLYGKGTRWCTAADNDNWFNYYNNQGPLYINVDKNTGEKYQFHFPSRSYMDAEDDRVVLSEIGMSDGLLKFYDTVQPYFSSMVVNDFDRIYDFNEGYAVVSNTRTGMQNMIGEDGELLSPDRWFFAVYNMCGGFAEVKDNRGLHNYLGKNGELLFKDRWFRECGEFHDGLAPVKNEFGWWNYTDTEGKFLFGEDMEKKLADAYEFRDGFATVCIDDADRFGYNFIDRHGNLLCKGALFSDAYSFHDGLAQVQLKDKSWNYVKKDGTLLRKDLNFSYADNFHDGRAAIRTSSDVSNGKFLPRAVYLIDTDGDIYDRDWNLVSLNPEQKSYAEHNSNESDMVSETMVERIVRGAMESLLR